jgi:cytochrome c oxidase cbb3-type subunit III
MSDFIGQGWGIYIAIVTILGIVGVCWLLFSMSSTKVQKNVDGSVGDTGHVWDEDLRELNNPLPRWWFWLFVLTIVFGIGYLVLYPGLGAYQGVLGYSSVKELSDDQISQNELIKPIYAKYMGMDIKDVAKDPQANEIGQRLFMNNCAQCHGSDAGGSKGFPNLTDNDWLYGGEPETIRTTILHGRHGMMPSFSSQYNSDQARDIAHYVRSLSGLTVDNIKVARGKSMFRATCAACHGAEGQGNTAMGAPNLSDQTWLYGSAEGTIIEGILNGRNNHMPSHESILTPEKVQLLTAYVWGLSHTSSK